MVRSSTAAIILLSSFPLAAAGGTAQELYWDAQSGYDFANASSSSSTQPYGGRMSEYQLFPVDSGSAWAAAQVGWSNTYVPQDWGIYNVDTTNQSWQQTNEQDQHDSEQKVVRASRKKTCRSGSSYTSFNNEPLHTAGFVPSTYAEMVANKCKDEDKAWEASSFNDAVCMSNETTTKPMLYNASGPSYFLPVMFEQATSSASSQIENQTPVQSAPNSPELTSIPAGAFLTEEDQNKLIIANFLGGDNSGNSPYSDSDCEPEFHMDQNTLNRFYMPPERKDDHARIAQDAREAEQQDAQSSDRESDATPPTTSISVRNTFVHIPDETIDTGTKLLKKERRTQSQPPTTFCDKETANSVAEHVLQEPIITPTTAADERSKQEKKSKNKNVGSSPNAATTNKSSSWADLSSSDDEWRKHGRPVRKTNSMLSNNSTKAPESSPNQSPNQSPNFIHTFPCPNFILHQIFDKI